MAHQQLDQLCCVGSKVPLTPASQSEELFPEAAWINLQKAAGEATSTLKEVIKGLQDSANLPESRQIPGGSRKVVMKKLVGRLIKVSAQLLSFQTQITDLKDRTSLLHKRLKMQQDFTQGDIVQKVDDIASTMQETLKRLQGEDENKAKLPSSLKDGKRVSFSLSKPTKYKEFESAEQESDILRLTANEEKLRAENEMLKKELELALTRKEVERSTAEQVERYKEVIAQVTADNMVFLMKLRQSEQALRIALEQQCNLTKQLDIDRLKFFEEISAEIEDTVLASLSKAEACEKELQTLQKDHEKKARDWQEKLQEAQESVHQANIIQKRVSELEEERVQILARLSAETKKKEDAQAEVFSLSNDVKSLNDQLSKLRTEHASELQEMQNKLRNLEAKEQEMDQILVTLNRTSAELETQHAINIVLMKKKEEMEWLYLEAKAEKENLQRKCRNIIQK